jgi:hypothetical protein
MSVSSQLNAVAIVGYIKGGEEKSGDESRAHQKHLRPTALLVSLYVLNIHILTILTYFYELKNVSTTK